MNTNYVHLTIKLFLLAFIFLSVTTTSCLPPIKAVPLPKDLNITSQYNEVSEETIERYYSWYYKDKTHLINLKIKKSFYEYFKIKKRFITPEPSIYSIYVTHPLDDADLNTVAATLKYIAVSEEYSTKEFAEFIVSFVRSLPWISDSSSTGFVEHPRFPIETLVDMTGDCEDTTFLLSTLLNAVGFKTVLLASEFHIGVGISVTPDKYPYFEYDGRKYYYIESTKSDYAIGQIPGSINPSELTVISLVPTPLLFQTMNISDIQGNTNIELLIDNVGSAPLDNVQVSLTIQLKDDSLVYEQTSDIFSLNVDNKAQVSFNLKLLSRGETPPIYITTKTLYSYNSENHSAVLTREFFTEK